MTYVKVRWIHSSPDYPVLLYSELDERRWEVRKVEIYHDRRCGYADGVESTEPTMLGLELVPSLPDIASDPQFEPEKITQKSFRKFGVDEKTES